MGSHSTHTDDDGDSIARASSTFGPRREGKAKRKIKIKYFVMTFKRKRAFFIHFTGSVCVYTWGRQAGCRINDFIVRRNTCLGWMKWQSIAQRHKAPALVCARAHIRNGDDKSGAHSNFVEPMSSSAVVFSCTCAWAQQDRQPHSPNRSERVTLLS